MLPFFVLCPAFLPFFVPAFLPVVVAAVSTNKGARESRRLYQGGVSCSRWYFCNFVITNGVELGREFVV